MPTDVICRYGGNHAGPVCNDCQAVLEGAGKDNLTKQRYRGCCNCNAFDPHDGKCRRQPPFSEVGPLDWCRDWESVLTHRLTWHSPLGPAEVHYPRDYNKEVLNELLTQ